MTNLTTWVMMRRPKTATSTNMDSAANAMPRAPLAIGRSWRNRRSPTKRVSTVSVAVWTSKYRECNSTDTARTFLWAKSKEFIGSNSKYCNPICLIPVDILFEMFVRDDQGSD